MLKKDEGEWGKRILSRKEGKKERRKEGKKKERKKKERRKEGKKERRKEEGKKEGWTCMGWNIEEMRNIDRKPPVNKHHTRWAGAVM